MSLAHQSQTGAARPPIKGSFPLDRRRECEREEAQYLQCLGSSSSSSSSRSFDHLPCRGLAEEFLRCRMEANLMSKEDLRQLGFRPSTVEGESPAPPSSSSSPVSVAEQDAGQVETRRKEEEGFLGGLQAIQPYTTRGFFGRLAARYSWSNGLFDFSFLRRPSRGFDEEEPPQR